MSIEHHDTQSATERGGEVVCDDWLRDEWWRANNPGASAARGALWAAGAAALLWPVLIGLGWWVSGLLA